MAGTRTNMAARPVAITGSNATEAAAVTPNDSTDLSGGATKGLWVGGAGDIKVDFAEGGTAVVIGSVPAGTLLPFSVTRVYATDTAATEIVALY